jgi:magnesium transporter
MSLELLKQEFEHVLQSEDPQALHNFLDQQNITEIADLVYEEPDRSSEIIASMSVHRASGVFRILEFGMQKRIIEELTPTKVAELLNELPPDDRTSFLEDLPSNVVRELIKQLNPEERKITLSLLGYPENSVGRLMTPDYVYVYEDNTVAQVINIIRRVGKNTETIDVIYVINDKGELLDDIRIREFILADPSSRVSELMDDRVISLNAYQDQEEAADAFKMNNRVALPVVSNSDKLLGIVTIDDILWVASEEFSEDIQKIGGTEALEEPYLEMPLLRLVRKRAGWLVVLFFGELLTAAVMHYFEAELARALVLAQFIPLIISSGGNSGSQASTLIIQALSVGEIAVSDWWRIMRREIVSGLLLGGILGVIGFMRIVFWHLMMKNGLIANDFGIHWVYIGFAIGCTVLGVVLWGTLTGSMLPLVLKKLGADPAVSSAPFVATLVDVTGLIIYFSVAYLFLSGRLL